MNLLKLVRARLHRDCDRAQIATLNALIASQRRVRDLMFERLLADAYIAQLKQDLAETIEDARAIIVPMRAAECRRRWQLERN